jgi:DNA-binding PadR family transcriptional regulator
MHHDYGFGGPSHRRHGGGYFGRGGIKFAILSLLKEKPRHGYDIIREMEERSGGLYTPSPGVIYPTLQALEDQDYVTSNEQEGKKVYSITDSGSAYLQGHKEQMRERHGGPPRGPSATFWSWPGSEGAARTTRGQSGSGPDEAAGTTRDSAHSGETEPEGAGDQREAGHRHGHRGTGGTGTGAFGSWFMAGEMPELMKELRWFFGDFAGALQRTVADPQKIKEIREVLREAKHKIDDIVMR